MVKTTAVIAALAASTAAWPTVMQQDMLLKRAAGGRLNTGAGHPNPTFDAKDQYVDVTDSGPNPFKAPGSGDLRGECPGLNAAANHGFLPRSGKATIQQTVDGLGKAYNMSPELAIGLAAIAILISGDIPSATWSIGSGFASTLPLVLSNPKGIVGTHNKYEGDSSIVRGDAYLNNGNVGVVQWHSWNNLMKLADGGLTLDEATAQSNFVTQYSVNNNPYYFSGPFSGLVAPAAHNFVANFMSNHSAEQPGGYLSKEVLQSFFAISGTGAGASGDNPGDYVHNIGMERIPENWYRRPSSAQYSLADVFLDLLAGAQQYPDTLRIGGNTGTTNSFTGVDVGNLTGGVFNGASLFQDNNLACFAFRAAQAGSIDELNGVLNTIGNLISPLTDQLNTALSALSCPQLSNYNSQLFSLFPGYKTT
ncbi:Dothistromin biosynthesis peroxidase dotB [Pseudocercospora fuligena]|uniref:Dothistromin biosynthesis peroxidase dotB n=1 Tax=Pseudocercospora fuligena TaxID=685502 RepID=A0A8H6RVH2_9PEZI|nr:Dothistromin biosynthesis peroxidase dotB [Pseudocercospora fuligena]